MLNLRTFLAVLYRQVLLQDWVLIPKGLNFDSKRLNCGSRFKLLVGLFRLKLLEIDSKFTQLFRSIPVMLCCRSRVFHVDFAWSSVRLWEQIQGAQSLYLLLFAGQIFKRLDSHSVEMPQLLFLLIQYVNEYQGVVYRWQCAWLAVIYATVSLVVH